MPLDLSKPVQTRDGRKVRILCTDAEGLYPVVGLIEEQDPETWTALGCYECNPAFGKQHNDLVNVPGPWPWAGMMREVSPAIHPEYAEHIYDLQKCITEMRQRIDGIEVKYRPGQGLET